MAGVQHRRGEIMFAGFTQEIGFDGALADSVIAEWPARYFFGDGDLNGGALHPICPAVEEPVPLAAQRLGQGPRAFDRIAYEVDHDHGFGGGDFWVALG